MNHNPLKEHANKLLFLTAALIISCTVITVFFKTNIILKAGSRLLTILQPFLFGAVIAYLINPLVGLIERGLKKLFKRKPRFDGRIRMVSIIFSLILTLAVIGLMLLAVLPEVIRSLTRTYREVPALLTQFNNWVNQLDKGPGTPSHELVKYVQQTTETLSGQLQEFLRTSLLPTLRGMLPHITSSFMDMFSFIYNFGIGCIIASYLLGAKEKFFSQARLVVYSLFPEKAADWIAAEVHITDRMFSGFIHGKVLDSAIIGVVTYIFCWGTKMPYALLISMIVGVTNIIPFFGPYIGMVPSAVLILTASPARCLLFLAFIILLQQIDGNILGPALLGDKLGLSGIWILFSIMIFSSFMGIAGMIIGAPIFAVIYDLIRRFVYGRLRRKDKAEMVDSYLEQYHQPAVPPKHEKPKEMR